MSHQPTAALLRRRRRWARGAALTLLAIGLLVPGCTSTQSRARKESTERWNRVRAQVKLKLAADHLAAGHVEDAATELAAAVRLDPANPELQTLQARLCLARGQLSTAQRLLEGARGEEQLRGEVEYLLGVIQEQHRRWDAAREHYVRAADADPQEVAYLAAIVQAMLQLGRTADALALLESHEPQFGWTGAYLAALAECHEQLQDWAAAASAWRKVVDTHDDPDIRERLAVALYRAGSLTEAARLFERLLDETTTEPEAYLRLALADCLLAEGQPGAAHQQLDRVLRDDPRNARALQFDAQAFAHQGKFRHARELAERALRLAPDDLRALELAATLALKAGDTDRARELAERIARVAPDANNPVAYQILACLARAALTAR
jgi:tetratricopeptide (TPR) repeat protein